MSYRPTTDCFVPRTPHDWHVAPAGPAHTASAPHFRQRPSWIGCAAQAAHFLFKRVLVAVFGRGARQTGQCFPPRLTLDTAFARFRGRCRDDSASISWVRPSVIVFRRLTTKSLGTSGRSRPRVVRSRSLPPQHGVRPRGPEDCTQPSRLHSSSARRVFCGFVLVAKSCAPAQRYSRSAAGASGSEATDAPVRLQRRVRRTSLSTTLTSR